MKLLIRFYTAFDVHVRHFFRSPVPQLCRYEFAGRHLQARFYCVSKFLCISQESTNEKQSPRILNLGRGEESGSATPVGKLTEISPITPITNTIDSFPYSHIYVNILHMNKFPQPIRIHDTLHQTHVSFKIIHLHALIL